MGMISEKRIGKDVERSYSSLTRGNNLAKETAIICEIFEFLMIMTTQINCNLGCGTTQSRRKLPTV
jgi:hypothetical protein